jgi:hypothetical protein
MIDLYTKTVLTVIAVALCVIAVKGLAVFGPAVAQGTTCGDRTWNACYVRVTGTVEVNVGNIVDVKDPLEVTGTVDIANPVEVTGLVSIDTGTEGLPVRLLNR